MEQSAVADEGNWETLKGADAVTTALFTQLRVIRLITYIFTRNKS